MKKRKQQWNTLIKIDGVTNDALIENNTIVFHQRQWRKVITK